MKREKKRMAAVMAILGAVTLLAGCGRNNNDTAANGAVGGLPGQIFPGVPGFNGQPAGAGCAQLNPQGNTTLGFSSQIQSSYNSGASSQTAVMNSQYGMIAVIQVATSGGQQGYGYGVQQINGQITITPQGAQILLAEAGIGNYGGYGVNICIQDMRQLTLNPLRGGIYLSGLPMPRSGLPHLVFSPQ